MNLRLAFAAIVSTSLMTLPAVMLPAASNPPGSVTGTLLDASGKPAAGATVELSAVPPAIGNPDAPIVPLTFAEATTDSDGSFVLDGIPPGLAGLRHGTGAVELMITGSVGDHAVYHSLLAAPPTDNDGPWTAEGQDTGLAPVTLQIGAGALEASDIAAAIQAGEPVEPAPVGDEETPTESDLIPGAALTAAAGSKCRSGYFVYLVPQDVYQRRFPPIQRLRTRAHSVQRYEFETTGRTQLEVAWTGDGGNYAGGFTYSRESQQSLGYRWTQKNRLKQVLRPEWEYRRYRVKCIESDGGYNPDSYLTNTYQWRANRLTTGGRLTDSEASWTCAAGKTVRMPVETWVAKSSTVVWDNWFSVATVKLNSRQTNTSSHKLTVIPDSGERSPRICGDSGYPDESNRIKERVDP